jgi:hypothetical protein
VGGRVPESFLTFGSVELEKLNLAVAFKRTGSVPLHPTFTLVLCISLRVDKAVVERGDATSGVAYLADNNFFRELL